MLERKGNVLIADSWDEFNIDVPPNKINAGDFKVRVCPECKDSGKKNWNDSSLSINPSKGVGRCHKCESRFIIRQESDLKEKKFTPPDKKNITPLSAAGLKLFTDRMISQESVVRYKIAERVGSIAFPYMYEGECVNIKYRGIADKKFAQSPDGLHVMYGHDQAKEYMEASGDFSVLITEGEFDVLAFDTAGIQFAVSVDAGAPNPNDKIEKKLECLTTSFDLFELAETIYIAVDADENGERLKKELIRRLPFDKIKIISFGDHKDANDYLRFEGKDKLKDLLKKSADLKMDGIFDASDAELELWDMYHNGLPMGQTTHFPSIDKHWKIREGEVTIFTGYNNEGKSNILHNIVINKAVMDEWTTALYSPESFPAAEWFEDAIHTYLGKSSSKDFKGRSTEDEFRSGIEFMKNRFFLVQPEESATLDELFKRFDFLVRKNGVRVVIIDPFNQVEHMMNAGETLDLYISRFMGKLKRFAITRRVSVILVAHQNPPKTKDAAGNYPMPDLYSIKGGGTFGDKSDNVVVVWRPYRWSDNEDPTVKFVSKKIKKKKLTGVDGECDVAYQWESNRYLDKLLQGRSPLDIKLAIPREDPLVESKPDVMRKAGKEEQIKVGNYTLL